MSMIRGGGRRYPPLHGFTCGFFVFRHRVSPCVECAEISACLPPFPPRFWLSPHHVRAVRRHAPALLLWRPRRRPCVLPNVGAQRVPPLLQLVFGELQLVFGERALWRRHDPSESYPIVHMRVNSLPFDQQSSSHVRREVAVW